jgi:hypothetical protein
MAAVITYRKRAITPDDIKFIQKLIAERPQESRRALSKRICLAWNWTQPNGCLKDMVCRGMLLQLERGGHIVLPPKKRHPHNPLAARKAPAKVEVDISPIQTKLKQLLPLTILQVRKSSYEELFNSLLDQYHYLGYTQPVGEHLKYLVFSGKRPLACFSWSSAARHIGCRDRFIGWDQKARQKNLPLLAYNSRFLIMPWVRVPYLASHLLGKISRRISSDWEKLYQHRLYFLETFVDTERFSGTCYRAANWIHLGQTTGRGKNDQTHRVNRSVKDVYGFSLSKDFKERMRHV